MNVLLCTYTWCFQSRKELVDCIIDQTRVASYDNSMQHDASLYRLPKRYVPIIQYINKNDSRIALSSAHDPRGLPAAFLPEPALLCL